MGGGVPETGCRGGVAHRCGIGGRWSTGPAGAGLQPLVEEAALGTALLGVDGNGRIVIVDAERVGPRRGGGRHQAHHREGDGATVGAHVLGTEADPSLGGTQGGAGQGAHAGDGEAARRGGGGGRTVAWPADADRVGARPGRQAW